MCAVCLPLCLASILTCTLQTLPVCQATRCQFENSNEVGVFSNLTNAYCIVALGAAENFYRCDKPY